MAFDKSALKRIASAPVAANDVASMYMYFTNDAAAAVETAGYFTGATVDWKKGDILMVSLERNATAKLKVYVVGAVSASNVPTISAQTVA